MTQEEFLVQFSDSQILVPRSWYHIEKDRRLLIPFTVADKIGFLDSYGNVVVEPQYTKCFGNCYQEDHFVMVGKPFVLATKSEGVNPHPTYLCYGLLNAKGKEIIPVEYRRLLPMQIEGSDQYDYCLLVAQNKQLEFGVINIKNEVVVPFGKYEWIDGYSWGFARFKSKTEFIENGENPTTLELKNDQLTPITPLWGLLDKQGRESTERWQEITKFYGVNRRKTSAISREGASGYIKFGVNDAHQPIYKFHLSRKYSPAGPNPWHEMNTWGEYEGTWAQEMEGFSDWDIDNALDGEADAIWNIL